MRIAHCLILMIFGISVYLTIGGSVLRAEQTEDQFRDPFRAPVRNRVRAKTKPQRSAAPRPPGLSGQVIREVKLRGIVTFNSHRLAVLETPDQCIYMVEEGARLFDGVVKTILRDGIVFTGQAEGAESDHKTTVFKSIMEVNQ